MIRVGKTYYVWYTQRKAGAHPYASTGYYATSADGDPPKANSHRPKTSV